MSEERCLRHGCAMPYDMRSGFNLCPECEAVPPEGKIAPLGEFTYVGKGTPSQTFDPQICTCRDGDSYGCRQHSTCAKITAFRVELSNGMVSESGNEGHHYLATADADFWAVIEGLQLARLRAGSLFGAERWLTWVEPFGPNNEPVYMFVPESTAVSLEKKVAWESKGYRYKTDKDALEDFMAVNWAWFTEKPKGVL